MKKNHSIVESAIKIANDYLESMHVTSQNSILYKRIMKWHEVNPDYTAEDLAALALCGDEYNPHLGLPSADILRLTKAILFDNILGEIYEK